MQDSNCNDCFTRVEFKESVVREDFSNIESVLKSQKDNICMFMIDDYLFSFTEYLIEQEEKVIKHWVIGEYITPIPHLAYMSEEEIQFRISETSMDRFTFFNKNEIIVTMHGMVFHDGEFKENLANRFNIIEIKNLSSDVLRYITKKYVDPIKDDEGTVYIQNQFKSVGIFSNKE